VTALTGTVDRRILIVHALDPDRARALLPPPFRPDLSLGVALGGVCALRVSGLRPAVLPRAAGRARLAGLAGLAGLSFEAVIHRIAVEWDTPDGVATGAYVLRRDTDSALAAALAPRFLPGGAPHRALFGVIDTPDRISLAMHSRDTTTAFALAAHPTDRLPAASVFTGPDSALAFDRCGRVGWAPDPRRGGFGGVRLDTPPRAAVPLAVEYVQSSVFEDRELFPRGSAVFDHALLLRDLPGRWTGLGRLGRGSVVPVGESGRAVDGTGSRRVRTDHGQGR
jgi:hypothetical protein